ncbi:DUF927 domain-containing protein [Methylobacterium fujisawaense]|uniref:DUF927 domain-containing protein n=1 Tax=Methylobacterium fujisawaense TaxID=107400 RepID=UPI0036F9D49C
MSTKPRVSEAAPRRRHPPDPVRRSAPSDRMRPSHATAPSILDAVRDQHGGRWIRYGTQRRAIWFVIADLIRDGATVFGRLSSVGAACLTSASQAALKRSIETHEDYRAALVATRPGWLEGSYVFGDGTVAAPEASDREVIVTFETNAKFTPRGTLGEWQEAVAPFVAGQPLSYFAVSLALSGPVLRVAPRGFLNPQVEIVGGGEVGKTSLAVLAASVWAGNPDSDCGGGEIWDITLNALDDVKLAHRDGFLFLDEGNLMGATLGQRREFARQAVFKVATTAGRRRMGDALVAEHARLSLLSTTNTALSDLIEGSADVRHAAQSRMITIRIEADAPHGVFARVPRGFANARAASEAMRDAADQFWGAAARAFVARLVQEVADDEEGLKRLVAQALGRYMRRDSLGISSARAQKTLALVAVTAALARRWGILPGAWGSPVATVQTVARSALQGRDHPGDPEPLAAILSYVARHRPNLIDASDLLQPLSKVAFESAAGILRTGRHGREILIPAARFQATFQDAESMMRSLRDAGRAQVEGGRAPKLTIKTPRAICAEGRVYCIRLGEPGAKGSFQP